MNEQLSLSELNALIKESLELAFPEHVWVVAEIGELKVNRSGHCYMELVEKEEETNKVSARTRATIWSWQYRFIQPYFETTTGQTLQGGLKVLVAVSVQYHEVYGISLNIKDIDPNYTLGDMARKRQEVIYQLTEEGVFDMNKEIPLSDIPARIAIISSPTAAGYEDFINQLQNNNAGYQFYTKLFEATMQGNEAVASIISAFEYIYNFEDNFDTVVLIRGGGSQLDLSCFDDYDLALNITQFPLPVLTGIGHEKDESVADMVAHTRLKTPTAVAEFLISKFDNCANEISQLETILYSEADKFFNINTQRLEQALRLFKPIVTSSLDKKEMQLKQLVDRVKPMTNEVLEKQRFSLLQLSDELKHSVKGNLKQQENQLQQFGIKIRFGFDLQTSRKSQFITEKEHQLKRFIDRKLEKETNKLEWLERNKELVDPKHILKRGFSITLKNGKVVKNSSIVSSGDQLEIILGKGKLKTEVKNKQ